MSEDTESEALHVVPIVLISVAIGTKGAMMVYCLLYRQYPSVHVFYIDHRNDIAINSFGLVMAVVGDRFVWYLDPIGAIIIALIILFSWVSNAFEQVWLLVGKSAPREFIAKLVYMAMNHNERIIQVETVSGHHILGSSRAASKLIIHSAAPTMQGNVTMSKSTL